MQKLNEYDLISYDPSQNYVTFVLSNTTLSDALKLDGVTLTVYEGEKSKIVFKGYKIISIEVSEIDETQIILKVIRKLDDRTEDAISALDANVIFLNEKMNNTENVANNAKKFAEEHGMPPYVKAATMIYAANSTDINNTDALSIRELFPEFALNTDYKKGQIIRYGENLYRIGQDHTSQEQWTPGADGTTALYSKIDISGDGYETWQTYDGVSGTYAKDQIVRDPTNEQLYKSLIDNNVWGPPSEQPDYWELYEA